MKKRAKKPVKDSVINVRCTSKQKALLEKAAARDGLGVSTWLLRLGVIAVREN